MVTIVALVTAMLMTFAGASSECFTTGTDSGIMCSNYDTRFSKSKVTLQECMDLCTQSKAAGGCRALFFSTKGGNCRHVYGESCKPKSATWPYQVLFSIKLSPATYARSWCFSLCVCSFTVKSAPRFTQIYAVAMAVSAPALKPIAAVFVVAMEPLALCVLTPLSIS